MSTASSESSAIKPQPIRSQLFVPGNREDWMRKALASEADALIFDLESAIPRGEAEAGRAMCARVLESHQSARPLVFVRVSEARSPEHERDVAAVVGPHLHGILLPQIRGPEDVATADRTLTAAEQAADVAPGSTIVMPLVETANAVRTAFEIATASPRVAYMGGGVSRGGDIARSLGYEWTPEGRETLFLRSKVLVDVRAAGIANPISGLWGIVEDRDGLRVFAEESRRLGYEGLMAIHPSHVPVINDVFSPSADQIAEWQGVIAAMAHAEEEGRGAIRLKGRLIDAAHVATAEQDLARARALGLVE